MTALARKIFEDKGDYIWGYLAKQCGFVSGLLLYAGIIRYTFLFPDLAKMRVSGSHNPDSIDLVFEAFNRYIGDSLAEHVQFTFTSFAFLFLGMAIVKTRLVPRWIAFLAFATSMLLGYGNLEFFGAPGAFVANRIGADITALWLIIFGFFLVKNYFAKKESSAVSV